MKRALYYSSACIIGMFFFFILINKQPESPEVVYPRETTIRFNKNVWYKSGERFYKAQVKRYEDVAAGKPFEPDFMMETFSEEDLPLAFSFDSNTKEYTAYIYDEETWYVYSEGLYAIEGDEHNQRYTLNSFVLRAEEAYYRDSRFPNCGRFYDDATLDEVINWAYFDPNDLFVEQWILKSWNNQLQDNRTYLFYNRQSSN